jgi:hypothetical protein
MNTKNYRSQLETLMSAVIVASAAQQAAQSQAQADAADQEAFRCELDILDFRNEISEIKNQLAEYEAKISMESRQLKWEKDGKNYIRRSLSESEARRLSLLENSEKYLSNAGIELSAICEEIDAFLSPSESQSGEATDLPVETPKLKHVIAPEFVEQAFHLFESCFDTMLESEEGSRFAWMPCVPPFSDHPLSSPELQAMAVKFERVLMDAKIVRPNEDPFKIIQDRQGKLTIGLL